MERSIPLGDCISIYPVDIFQFFNGWKHIFGYIRISDTSDSWDSGGFWSGSLLWRLPSLHPQARSLPGIFSFRLSDNPFHIPQILVFFWKNDMDFHLHPHTAARWDIAAVCTGKNRSITRFTSGHVRMCFRNVLSAYGQKTISSSKAKQKGRITPWICFIPLPSLPVFFWHSLRQSYRQSHWADMGDLHSFRHWYNGCSDLRMADWFSDWK